MKEPKSVDEMLALTGDFGHFQWILSAMMAYCMTTVGLQGLTMTFISHEPMWKCSANSTRCNVTYSFKLGMDYYKERCNMNSSDWVFEDSFTSIITQVIHYLYRIYRTGLVTPFKN